MHTRFRRRFLTCLFSLFVVGCPSGWGQATVTLSSASPSAGQPGVTVINVLGSGYPAGTIPPTDVAVTLQPATAGAGPSGATLASAVTTIVGSTRRVTFTIPTTISVTNPTTYKVSISGMTSTGTSFASGNSATLTVNPAASILSVTPNTGQPGQTLSITLTCAYTNLVTGASQVSFGPGIAVGGAAAGAFGPVTATSATTATFQITIDAAAASGPRTVQVQTGLQTASLTAGFSVTSPVTNLPPPAAAPGGPYTGVAGQAVTFNGAGSSNPAGNPLSYLWYFGDGGTDSSGPTPTHTYAATGNYTVTLVVTDLARAIACSSVQAFNQCQLTDTGSAVTSATINRTSNVTPPTVTITSPASLTLLNQRSVNVTGTVTDPNYASVPVVVNGVNATVTGSAFQATVPLKEGDNTLTATATDGAGNAGTASITVVVDTTPPNIQINMPANNSVVSSASIDVTGVVNDAVSGTVNAAQVTITVNGTSAMVSNRSFLLAGLPLQTGVNKITVVATDRAGNQGQTTIQVTRQASFQPQVIAFSGNNQTGVAGTTLANPLVVQLLDTSGNPLAVRPVMFTVVKSDGQLLGFGRTGQNVLVNTNAAGQASIPFQLGTRAGVGINQVVATYAGSTSKAVFVESSTPGPISQIHVVSGNVQNGVIGEPLPSPLVAIVMDDGGNPIAGVNVTFTVDHGGGNIGGQTTFTSVSDTDGKIRAVLTLGRQEGINNNTVTADFSGDSSLPALFTASGLVAGDPAATTVSGVVLDNANNPIANATATIVGTNLSAVSNSQGAFTITGVPVGAITLMVDGRTSTRPETFPFLSYNLTTIAGQNNTIGMPVLLPPLDTTDSQIVGGAQNVVLTMTGVPGFQLTVFANSVTFPDGTHVGRMSFSQVHSDKVPMQPPNGTAPLIVATIQPSGVIFNPPAQVQAPNLTGLAPGTVLDYYSYDHDLEQFISQGPARVSSDGSVLVSDPGFGIVKSGWDFPLPLPEPPACVDPPPECNKVVKCKVVPDDSQNDMPCKGPFPAGLVQGTDTVLGDCSTGSCTAVFNDTRFAGAGTGEDKMNFAIDKSCFGTCQKGVCMPQATGFNVGGIEFGLDEALSFLFDPGESCIGGGLRNTMQLNATSISSLGGAGLQIFCAPGASGDQTGAITTPGGRVLELLPPIFAAGMTILFGGSVPAHEVNPASLLHEFVHAFANDPGAEGHNDFELPGNPPALTAQAAALAAFATDRPYGCEASCGAGQGGGNPKACQ